MGTKGEMDQNDGDQIPDNSIVFKNITFEHGATIEYPEDHSLIFVDCQFNSEQEPILIKVVPRTVPEDEIREAARKLELIEKDLKDA